MKALSLIQPWATLIAIGAKRLETRHWATGYRGPIAIHASKWRTDRGDVINPDVDDCLQLSYTEPFRSALVEAGLNTISDLPSGAIVALARLVDVVPTTSPSVRSKAPYGSSEREFGNYAPGRYAWVLDDVRPLARPIVIRGQPGLWTVPLDVVARCAEATV